MLVQAAIRRELNDFKSAEMEVHKESRHMTRFVFSCLLLITSAMLDCIQWLNIFTKIDIEYYLQHSPPLVTKVDHQTWQYFLDSLTAAELHYTIKKASRGILLLSLLILLCLQVLNVLKSFEFPCF